MCAGVENKRMDPLDEVIEESKIPAARVWPPCWHCQERHHHPWDIYRCDSCGLALCAGEVFAGGRTSDGSMALPLTHRPLKAGRRKGESSTGFCGPASFIGEVAERTK